MLDTLHILTKMCKVAETNSNPYVYILNRLILVSMNDEFSHFKPEQFSYLCHKNQLKHQ